MRALASIAFVGCLVVGFESSVLAGECTGPNAPIETDRPDVTNSAVVVPVGSLQNENGVDLQRKDAAQALSGTNSRWRFGVAPCLEVLVDLPNYFTTFHGAGASGFGDVVPAIKWQLNLPQSKLSLSITAGAALPSGANGVSGPGVQPYLQVPWSIELGGGWALNGMETGFFAPEAAVKFTYQSTVVIEKEIAERAFVFVEYVGTFPTNGGNSQLLNSGAGYRIDNNHQIDFHIGIGLDRSAPDYIVGMGYSFRLDRILHPRS
jgi:outer membrane putative beta-barrel porin/alpha-amylase